MAHDHENTRNPCGTKGMWRTFSPWPQARLPFLTHDDVPSRHRLGTPRDRAGSRAVPGLKAQGLTLLHGEELALGRAGVNLARARDLGRRVVDHLTVVRDPAGE